MNKRVCSLETEYALVSNLLGHDSLGRDDLADMIEQAILSNHRWVRCNSFGRRSPGRAGSSLVEIREGQFVENGSRVYYDVGHFEWANPETLDPRSAVVYEKAAERNLAQAVALANEQLQKTYPQGWVMLVKNNVDYHGDTSYGCHENYSLRRYDDKGRDTFVRLADDLVPFVVTRQIFCGAGRIGARLANPDAPVAFQLSQRADFIELLQSPNTREERGLLNLRDEPLAESKKWRRLHLILGDSNMSEFATFLKIGSTILVLDLIEAGLVRGRWALRDPVGALHQVSHNWRRARLALRRGGKATALAIQREYWRLAQQAVSNLPADHFAHQVVEAWAQTLDDLADNGPRLRRRLDWAIKKHYLFGDALRTAKTDWKELGYWEYVVERTKAIPPPPEGDSDVQAWLKRYLPRSVSRHLDHYVKTHGLDWHLYPVRRRLLSRLREMDFRYHDIHPDRGLYVFIASQGNNIERLTNDREIALAQREPPKDTRAWQRGQVIDLCNARQIDVEMDWDKVLLGRSNRILTMSDPFTPDQINLERVLGLERRPFRIPRPPSGKAVEIKIISVEDLKED